MQLTCAARCPPLAEDDRPARLRPLLLPLLARAVRPRGTTTTNPAPRTAVEIRAFDTSRRSRLRALRTVASPVDPQAPARAPGRLTPPTAPPAPSARPPAGRTGPARSHPEVRCACRGGLWLRRTRLADLADRPPLLNRRASILATGWIKPAHAALRQRMDPPCALGGGNRRRTGCSSSHPLFVFTSNPTKGRQNVGKVCVFSAKLRTCHLERLVSRRGSAGAPGALGRAHTSAGLSPRTGVYLQQRACQGHLT